MMMQIDAGSAQPNEIMNAHEVDELAGQEVSAFAQGNEGTTSTMRTRRRQKEGKVSRPDD